MIPLFGEKQAIEFFSDLALMKEIRPSTSTTTPSSRELYILTSISSFRRLWLREPAITTSPIPEGQRLATLLYKHASQIQDPVDREYYIKKYFPECFDEEGDKLEYDDKWKGINVKERKEFFRPFLKAAGERFRELAVMDGIWDAKMEGGKEGDVEMDGVGRGR